MMLILTFMVLAHTAAIGYCDEPKLCKKEAKSECFYSLVL